MRGSDDWSWKLQEAIERIKTRYEYIGRKTGAPFLAIVYPPEVEIKVLKEWRTLAKTLSKDFDVKTIDVLAVTMSVIEDVKIDNILGSIGDPMPGSNPESELGHMWVTAITNAVEEASRQETAKTVIVLENLASLYPVTGPRTVMQNLWDNEHACLDGPVVILIPGTLKEPRVYSFVNKQDEFMYRGDVL
jgi:hypothetical protein